MFRHLWFFCVYQKSWFLNFLKEEEKFKIPLLECEVINEKEVKSYALKL